METLMQYLPFLIPLAIAQLVLMIVALVHVLRHPNYRIGNRPVWVIGVVLFQFIGPVVYFVLGRERE